MAETVYSRKQIEEWEQKLEELANQPRTRFTKKHAVEAMIEKIEKALDAHSYEEVAERLKDWGLEISPGLLKQYVNAYRRSQRSGKSGVSRKNSRKGKKSTASSVKRSGNGKGMPSVSAVGNSVGDSKDSAGVSAIENKLNNFIDMDEDL